MSSIKSFKPLFDRVLIQRLRNSEVKTTGGIFIPDKVGNKTNEAVVIEVGTGRRTGNGFAVPLLKKGDRVLVNESPIGERIKVNGVDCEILSENDILGFMEN
ncbi:hypothetical protein DICPUDRAFT_80912 [Dictyostelium purpureum]|uniref:Chaperonin 10 n=1 Tax=Dictyostelium purpureum TaxID=5786 RepID=F0ZRW9_DICPU|nr:uncharacterized protein DICPUDRAFT_80912 [Dictyostelium purpureum]EGC33315.1 hypothetical protein DICPUDRAFT_80912 [Dictyostelium purpureum]|eukprot:XP_003290171.1 hypothetical protein DICPUDRAFT_80912 [Dictyostelium purpureum]